MATRRQLSLALVAAGIVVGVAGCGGSGGGGTSWTATPVATPTSLTNMVNPLAQSQLVEKGSPPAAMMMPGVVYPQYIIGSEGVTPLGIGNGNPPFVPSNLRHAYGFDTLTLADGVTPDIGTGQIIAIIDPFGSTTIRADLHQFDQVATIGVDPANTDPTLIIATPDGPISGGTPQFQEETSLDVEWAHAIAPGAEILLIETTTTNDDDVANAVNFAANFVDASGRHVNQISLSLGGSEPGTGFDADFNHPGVTIVASSGDVGAGAEWPAVINTVVGVGGTHLELASSDNVTKEVAWGGNPGEGGGNGDGSGGGPSQFEPKGTYQSMVSGAFRETPDVAYDADPTTGVRIISGGNPILIGGTSMGAPQWAALMALTNALRQTPITAANFDLYRLAFGPGYAQCYHDIKQGTNPNENNTLIFSCTTGYDEVTGLGSPHAGILVPQMALEGH